jgi:peroxiredoxin
MNFRKNLITYFQCDIVASGRNSIPFPFLHACANYFILYKWLFLSAQMLHHHFTVWILHLMILENHLIKFIILLCFILHCGSQTGGSHASDPQGMNSSSFSLMHKQNIPRSSVQFLEVDFTTEVEICENQSDVVVLKWPHINNHTQLRYDLIVDRASQKRCSSNAQWQKHKKNVAAKLTLDYKMTQHVAGPYEHHTGKCVNALVESLTLQLKKWSFKSTTSEVVSECNCEDLKGLDAAMAKGPLGKGVAPQLELINLAGEVLTVGSEWANGNWAVFFFSKKSCDGCLRSLSEINSALSEIEGLETKLVVILADSSREDAISISKKWNLKFPIYRDPDGKAAVAWGMASSEIGKTATGIVILKRHGLKVYTAHKNSRQSPLPAMELTLARLRIFNKKVTGPRK